MKDICFKCEADVTHPFHDDGTVNPPDVTYFMGIDWFDEEREDREAIQDGKV